MMMKTRALKAALILVGLTLIAGCATTGQPGAGSQVPPQVDIAEWDVVHAGVPMSVTPASSYASLQALTDASTLVVLAEVADQGPYLGHDLMATESQMEVAEVLKGTAPEGLLRLYTLGTPTYLPQHENIEGIGDPPQFDRTYVLFLTPVTELTDANSVVVPVTGVWRSTGFGHYVQNDDGTFAWDGEGTGLPESVTVDQVRAAVGATS